MTDMFQVLKADHAKVEAVLRKLTGERTAADAGKEAEGLVMDESRHEAAEEMYFWPAVESRVADGSELSQRGRDQEKEGKEILDALRKSSPGDGRFEELVDSFAAAARAHIAFEEQEVWPKLQTALSDEERDELGAKIETAEEAGPTRPHPHSPDSAGALKTAGVAAAVTDKLRDAAARRGN
jgi:hemerythrin superfamily protein